MDVTARAEGEASRPRGLSADGPYGPTVEAHFRNPQNLGALDDATVVAEAANPVCGDRVKIFLRIRDRRIELATFLAQGCPVAIAAASMTTVLLRGLSCDQARRLTNEDVDRALGGLPRNKRHCSVLAEEVIASALEQWERES